MLKGQLIGTLQLYFQTPFPEPGDPPAVIYSAALLGSAPLTTEARCPCGHAASNTDLVALLHEALRAALSTDLAQQAAPVSEAGLPQAP